MSDPYDSKVLWGTLFLIGCCACLVAIWAGDWALAVTAFLVAFGSYFLAKGAR